MRSPAVREGERCVFLQTRIHTPTSQALSLLAAASPGFLGTYPAMAAPFDLLVCVTDFFLWGL